MRFDYVRPNPEELQRVQDSFDGNVRRAIRESAVCRAQAKAASDRSNLVAAMTHMLANDAHARPDLWAAFAFDRDELAGLIADYLLARTRR